MATWPELVAFIRAHYKVAESTNGALTLHFRTEADRSQTVMVFNTPLQTGEEWIQIESPIGKLDAIDLRAALKEIGSTVCGGLASTGQFLTFRHAVPLANLDSNEFQRPLNLVVNTADRLEKKLTGADDC
ncbi:MAG: hypothetical protein WCP28_01380 [Actinomycetes bacterium]